MMLLGTNSILVLLCLINGSLSTPAPVRLGARSFDVSEEFGKGVYPYDGTSDYRYGVTDTATGTYEMPIVLYPDALMKLKDQAGSHEPSTSPTASSAGPSNIHKPADNTVTPALTSQIESLNSHEALGANGYSDVNAMMPPHTLGVVPLQEAVILPQRQTGQPWANSNIGGIPSGFQYSGNATMPSNVLPTQPTLVNIPDEYLPGSQKFSNDPMRGPLHYTRLSGSVPLNDSLVLTPIAGTAGAAEPGMLSNRESILSANGPQHYLMNADGTYNTMYSYNSNGQLWPVARPTYFPYEQPPYLQKDIGSPSNNDNGNTIGIHLRGPPKPKRGIPRIHLTLKCENCDIDGHGGESRATNENEPDYSYGNATHEGTYGYGSNVDDHNYHHHHRHHHHGHYPKNEDAKEGTEYIPPKLEDITGESESNNGVNPSDDSEKSTEEGSPSFSPPEQREAPPKPPRGIMRKKKGFFNFVKELAGRKKSHKDEAESTTSEGNESSSDSEEEPSFLEIEPSKNNPVEEIESNPLKVKEQAKSDVLHVGGIQLFDVEGLVPGEVVPDYVIYNENDERPLNSLNRVNSIGSYDMDDLPKKPQAFVSFLEVSPDEDDPPKGNIISRAFGKVSAFFKKWFTPGKAEPSPEDKTATDEVTTDESPSFGDKVRNFFSTLGSKIKGFFTGTQDSPSLLQKSSTTTNDKSERSALKKLMRAFSKLMKSLRHKKKPPLASNIDAAPQVFNTKKYFRDMKKYDKKLKTDRFPSFLGESSGLSADGMVYHHTFESLPTDGEWDEYETDHRPHNKPETTYTPYNGTEDVMYDGWIRMESPEPTAVRESTYYAGAVDGETNHESKVDEQHSLPAVGSNPVVDSSDDVFHDKKVLAEETAEKDAPDGMPIPATGDAPENLEISTTDAANSTTSTNDLLKNNRRIAFLKFIDKLCGIVENLFKPETTPTTMDEPGHTAGENLMPTTVDDSAPNPMYINVEPYPILKEDAYAIPMKDMHLVDDLNSSVHDLVDGELGKLLNGDNKQKHKLLYYAPLGPLNSNVAGTSSESPADGSKDLAEPSIVMHEEDTDSSKETIDPKTPEMLLSEGNTAIADTFSANKLADEIQDDGLSTLDGTVSIEGDLSETLGSKDTPESKQYSEEVKLSPKDDSLKTSTESNGEIYTTLMTPVTDDEYVAVLKRTELTDTNPEARFDAISEGVGPSNDEVNINSKDSYSNRMTEEIKVKPDMDDSTSLRSPLSSFETTPVSTDAQSSVKDIEPTPSEDDNDFSDLVRRISRDEIRNHISAAADSDEYKPLEGLVHSEKVFDVEDTMGKGHVKTHLKNLLHRFADSE